MSQRRHIYCGILICQYFSSVAVSTLRVEPSSTPVRVETIETHSPAALQLRKSSLGKWDSKPSASARPEQWLSTKSKTVLDSGNAYKNEVATLARRSLDTGNAYRNDVATANAAVKSDKNAGSETKVLMILGGLMLWVSMAVCMLAMPTGGGGKGSSEKPSYQQSPREVPHAVKQAPPGPPSSGGLEDSAGSFACRYRESSGSEKEALSLLLRCNIISKDEFASNCVSQEHIDECVWIASQMLEQKTLEDWVALSQNGRQSFEDTVAAIYEARENARANSVPVSPPQTDVGPLVSQSVVPLASAASLLKGGSSASLGSSYSFGELEHEKRMAAASSAWREAQPTTVPLAKQVPMKSPVPVLNCYEQADVDQMSFSSNDDALSSAADSKEEEEEEKGFASVFSSSRSPQDSTRSTPAVMTPAESYRSPPEAPSPKRFSLASQEIMTRPPPSLPARSPTASFSNRQ